MKERKKTVSEVICVLSEHPPISLVRGSSGWIITSGELNKVPKHRFFGENLAVAMHFAYQEMVLRKTKPNSTIQDLFHLCRTVADELNLRLDGADLHPAKEIPPPQT